MEDAMTMPLADAALAYAKYGWAVLPIRDKRPLCSNGVYGATTDPHAVRAMWREHPDANIGVRCDWFFVVDIDPRNGGLDSWLELLCNKQGEITEWEHNTWRAGTGSGGTHVYFQADERLKNVPLGKIADGIDIKGNGKHYVLVSPSKTQGQYYWSNRPSRTELYRAPEWLIVEILRVKRPLQLVAPPMPDSLDNLGQSIDRVRRALSYVKHIEPAVSGQGGHTQTLVTAIRVCRGFALSETEGYLVMSEWNKTCQPPWSEKDLRRKVREALTRGQMAMGALL
jgi:hypothetical protein